MTSPTTPAADVRRTKLVCTIGPASAERVTELASAGMDVARVNFSHGTRAEHARAAQQPITLAARESGVYDMMTEPQKGSFGTAIVEDGIFAAT